jgi:hypothetical protein
MAEPSQIEQYFITAFRIPVINAYNRLESRARSVDFDRSLKAEIRDPLWMLTRQWQFGEFKGEDAATAVTTQVEGEHTFMSSVNFPGYPSFAYNEKVPLEATVERETLRANLFLAVQMGRYFIKLMKQPLMAEFDTVLQLLIDHYKLDYEGDIHPNDREGRQLKLAATGKVFDGFLLYKDIVTVDSGITRFQKWLNDETIPQSARLQELSELFKAWYLRNYSQPNDTEPFAWQPSKLEYSFSVSSPINQQQQMTLQADRYHEGHLDWYSFDLTRDIQPERRVTDREVKMKELKSYIPSPVSFKGMPHPRFWMMEEGQTDFGKIDTSATGLLHLLLAEFGLTYSNDWFMIPYELSTNTLCELKKIIVKDVFGQYTLIRPAGTAVESQWQQWAMFKHTDLGKSPSASNLFYLAPALTKLQEGDPIEVVNFLRDEMANMVWAVENTVPSQAGKGVNGNEMALKNEEPSTYIPTPGVGLRYVLGTTVPSNWIPFIPVQMQGTVSEIQLQRATLPHADKPIGVVLNEKLAPYYINEEIVQRSGVLVSRQFQRARGFNGETILWLGRVKEAGKGEGWSNLKFDQIEDVV